MGEIAGQTPHRGTGAPLEPLLRKLAFIGGFVLFVMSMLVIVNVTLRGVADTSVTGVFDLVKIGAAMCVFLFLPLCQAKRGNIFVDSFTSSLPLRVRNGLDALWDVVYAALALFMCAAMLQGAREQFSTQVQTTQLAIPIWPFNLAAALLLGLLGVVSLMTAARLMRGEADR